MSRAVSRDKAHYYPKAVKALIACKAALDTQDSQVRYYAQAAALSVCAQGMTPLLSYCVAGSENGKHAQIAELIVGAGADIDIKDKNVRHPG